jgi:hypothetical protein
MKLSEMLRRPSTTIFENHDVFLRDNGFPFACALGKILVESYDGDVHKAMLAWRNARDVGVSHLKWMEQRFPELTTREFSVPEGFPPNSTGLTLGGYIDFYHSVHVIDWLKAADFLEANGL